LRRVQGSKVQGSAQPSAPKIAGLIEKETFALRRLSKSECWKYGKKENGFSSMKSN
jgi:hypothetical protein